MATEDGGPAFPTHQSHGNQPGMSLLDYFAAHAPTEIPDWFKHVSPPKEFPDMPQWEDLESREDQDIAKAFLDADCDLPEHLKWFGEQVNAQVAGRTLWKSDDAVQRFFQWRWYFAKQMLKSRQQKGA